MGTKTKEIAEKTRERSIGTLLGAAVGDALGAPVEFSTAQEIASRYGTVREMLGGGLYNWKPGEYTDDTSMMLCVAESLAEKKKCRPEDIIKKFSDWHKSNPKDVGDASSAKDKPKNGSIIACAPLSLMYYRDEEALIKASIGVSVITHRHTEAKLSCVLVNLLIAGLLNGFSRRDAYLYAVKRTREINSNFVKKYIDEPYVPDPEERLAADTLLIATKSFLASRSFEDAVVGAVNLGGDADTNGAVAGALAGAYFGRPAIPRRWTTRLNPLPAKHFVNLGETLFKIELL